MKALVSLQTKAQRMRKSGASVGDIAKSLGVAKSSVSMWVSEIKLSPTHKAALLTKRRNAGREAFIRAAKDRSAIHQKNIQAQQKLGESDLRSISLRDIHMLGLGLYWGEGYKKGSAELAFTNSDPLIAQFFIVWLERVFGAKHSDLVCRVSVNVIHKNREKEILDFWCRRLMLTRDQFTKASFVTAKQKRDYSSRGPHYGTLRIKLRGGSTLRARILSSIDVAAKKI